MHKEHNMARSKKCFKCDTEKPLSEFYKHKMMADGHLNKCKECTKKDVFLHRQKNIERIREYDKNRSKFAHRKELRVRVTKAWRADDVRRQKAHNAVCRAILNGKLVSKPCERCGETKTEAHHEDYDQPLNVVWFCSVCHKQRHKEINKMKASQ